MTKDQPTCPTCGRKGGFVYCLDCTPESTGKQPEAANFVDSPNKPPIPEGAIQGVQSSGIQNQSAWTDREQKFAFQPEAKCRHCGKRLKAPHVCPQEYGYGREALPTHQASDSTTHPSPSNPTSEREKIRSLVSRVVETDHQEEWLTDQLELLLKEARREARVEELRAIPVINAGTITDVEAADLNYINRRLAELESHSG